MASIVIYGEAVQDARNLLRSAQTSTMFDVLAVELFKSGSDEGSAFANVFANWVKSLQPINPDAGSGLDKAAAKKANTALAHAKARVDDFVVNRKIQDVFAIGDVLRAVGEYFEFGGGGSDATVTAVNDFREGLRNQLAFNKANRARQPVPDFYLGERPDVGVFKYQLLNRSTVKYMERFYGPYIGADISGTTTDALDVLAYFIARNPDIANLQEKAGTAIALGDEMVPIAAMVLQYHHSLMECGLALSLASKSMTTNEQHPQAAIPNFKYYDLTTLLGRSPIQTIVQVMQRGNAILNTDFAGRGLVVLRDLIDIQDSPYADVEIALLVENPTTDALFDLSTQYEVFSNRRRDLMLVESAYYQHTDPSLVAIAAERFGNLMIGNNPMFNQLMIMNSYDLQQLKDGAGAGQVFDSLDDALTAARAGVHAELQAARPPIVASGAQALPQQKQDVNAAAAPHDVAATLKSLDPKTVLALQKLLSSV